MALLGIKKACEIHFKVNGYYWRFAEGKHPLKIDVPRRRRGGKQVIVSRIKYGKKVNTICETISEAVELTGLSQTTIRKICRGVITTRKGYSCRFVNEEDKYNRLPEFDLYKRYYTQRGTNCKVPVRLTEMSTGEEFIFDSILGAARTLKINDKGIRHVIAGRYKQTEGYRVEVINRKMNLKSRP